MFYQPGSFNVTAVISNNFNVSKFYCAVDIYNKVENLTLMTNSPIPLLENEALVQWWYESPTDAPTKAFIDLSFGNGAPNVKALPFVVSLVIILVEVLIMNSMKTCPSVTFYFMKISFSDIDRKWILLP